MATGTTNPPGSADAIDLQANAINIDLWATGSSTNAPDRLGVPRKTLFGMQSEFELAMAGMAYETPVPYAAGIVMSRPTQLVQYLGENYKVKTGLLPFTTSGTFATDEASLVGVGDAVLRQDLLGPGGSARVSFIQAGTGAEARSSESKMREHLSVTDFMTPAERADALTGTPLLDHSPAFVSFIAQVLVQGGRGSIPKGTYKLDTNVIGDWTQVIEYDEGVVMSGAGILFAVQHIINKAISSREVRVGDPDPVTTVVGKYDQVQNTGGGPAYGHRHDYFSVGLVDSGFSVSKGNIARWDLMDNGGQAQARWTIAATPSAASGGTWGVVGEEMNIMNRAVDSGYVKTRGGWSRWSGGIQLVPESRDLAGGTGDICRNIVFSYSTAQSAGLNDLGFHCKTYNALLIENDSVAPNGRGVLASGDTTGNGALLPMYGLEIDQRWAQGINMTLATFTGNIAINFADNHAIAWGTSGPNITGSSTTGGIIQSTTGAGTIRMHPGGSPAMQLAPVASSVNFFNVNGQAAGSSPAMAAAGTDTNINFIVAAKGTGRVQVNTGSLAVFTAGKGLEVREGANAKQGVVTLVAGSAVVANTSVTANSRIQLTGQQDGGTPGFLRVSARTAATSFTITSSSGADTSVVAYEIFEPA